MLMHVGDLYMLMFNNNAELQWNTMRLWRELSLYYHSIIGLVLEV